MIAHLDAKGIEMIRRDQCAVVKKIQEKVLRLLFSSTSLSLSRSPLSPHSVSLSSHDLSIVKRYLTIEYQKIMKTSGHHSDSLLLDDFIFYKEVKFGYYSSIHSQPPGAIVATKAVLNDEMTVPPYNWRVPYLVVQGLPNAPLKHLVYDPIEVLRRESSLRLNVTYYITKCINPALDRILSLCGIDLIHWWYRDMYRPKMKIRHIHYDSNPLALQYHPPPLSTSLSLSHHQQQQGLSLLSSIRQKQQQQTTMDRFTTQSKCELCNEDAIPQRNLCIQCMTYQPQDSLILLMQRLNLTIKKEKELERKCQSCSHFHQEHVLFMKNELIGPNVCQSIECRNFHERNRLVMRIEDFLIATHDIQNYT